MKRVLILGAGFSHAVGHLPLQNDLFSSIKNKTQEFSSIPNRFKWGQSIIDYLSNLCPNKRFEEVYTEIENKINDLRISEMERRLQIDTRKNIDAYLYFILEKPKINYDILEVFVSKLIDDKTNIITFNYDTIIEQYLFDQKLWYPHDGYGLKFNIREIDPKWLLHKSKLKIIKPHGSINFLFSPLFEADLRLLNYHDDGTEFFKGYSNIGTKRKFTEYFGNHGSSFFIKPSFNKTIKINSEYEQKKMEELSKSLINLMRNELKQAEEISFIGYSLPSEDNDVKEFIKEINLSQKVITIIDPYANSVKSKLENVGAVINKNNVFNCTLEKYLQGSIKNC